MKKLIIALFLLAGLSATAQVTSTESKSTERHRTTKDGTVIDEFEHMNIKKREVLLFPGLHLGVGVQGGVTTFTFNDKLGRMPFSNRDLPSDPNMGSRFDYSAGLNVAVDYYLNKYVGIHTGIDFYRFQAGFRLADAMSAEMTQMPVGGGLVDLKDVDIHSYTELVNESYRNFIFEIPLGLAVRSKYVNLNAGLKFGYGFGTKIDYEYGTTHICTDDELVGSGTILHDECELDYFPGTSGTLTSSSNSAKTFNRFYVLGNFEFDYRVIDKMENVWLVGFFIDYGLQRFDISGENAHFFTWREGANEVNRYSDVVASNFTRCFRPAQIGLKLQFHLPLNPEYHNAYKVK